MKLILKKQIIAAVLLGIFLTGTAFAAGTTIQALLADHVKIQLNGTEFDMKNAEGEIVHPIAYNGTVYVPIRAVSENLGLDVQWDQEKQVVMLAQAPNDADNTDTSGTGTGTGTSNTGGSDGADNQNSQAPSPNQGANEIALKAAQNISGVMRPSKKGLHTFLMSASGGKHSEAAATYAVDHIDIDWKQNALDTANFFYSTVGRTKEQIKDHLLRVEQYTEEEAEYALQNLKP